MAFPRKLLAPGEGIVLEAHPNWSILAPRVTLFVLVVAACLAVARIWASAPLWVGAVLLGIVAVFLLALFAKAATWRSTSLVLTNMRVIYRTGVLRRLGREIPLERVQDVTFTQSLLERLVGAGSLTIESAGRGGSEPFPNIARPAAVQSLINRLICQPTWAGDHNATARRAPTAGPTLIHASSSEQSRADPSQPSSSDQVERLGELLSLGVITEGEYQAKRRRLLDGR